MAWLKALKWCDRYIARNTASSLKCHFSEQISACRNQYKCEKLTFQKWFAECSKTLLIISSKTIDDSSAIYVHLRSSLLVHRGIRMTTTSSPVLLWNWPSLHIEGYIYNLWSLCSGSPQAVLFSFWENHSENVVRAPALQKFLIRFFSIAPCNLWALQDEFCSSVCRERGSTGYVPLSL